MPIKNLHIDKHKHKRLEIHNVKSHPGIVWTDVNNPSQSDIDKLNKHLGIELSDLEDALDPNEVPRVKTGENYIGVIIKTPLSRDEHTDVTTLGIFILGNKVITVHKQLISAINEVHNATDSHFRHAADILYKLIDRINSNYLATISNLDKKIEEMEELVFEDPGHTTSKFIFKLKKRLVFFEQSLLGNREVISSIKKNNILTLTKRDLQRFIDLSDDINQMVSMVNSHKEMLTGALELHSATISNQLNRVMKRMTVIGSFVLIPTMIASIYGMNFGQPIATGASPFNMPELSWYLGYPFALTLMVVSIIALWIYFKKNKWL